MKKLFLANRAPKVMFPIIAVTAFLSGCAIATDTYLSDGSKGYSIKCNGALQNYGSCLEKAGELCGASGYSLINKEGAEVPYSNSQGGFSANQSFAAGGFSSSSGTIATRSIFVKCGNPKTKKKATN